ncbi:MAG: aminotransferase class I/II-fold pyridoxal phosphate-dependent enzyme [Lachnospira sp.]
MDIHFSKKSERFGSNIFNVLNDYKVKRINDGLPVYNLSVGTPDFAPAKHIMEAISKAALDPENYKYSLGDSEELLDSCVNWYRKRYNVILNHNQITSVFGTQEGMAHIALALCDEGDLVLVPNPGYPIFEIGPYLCGADIAYYNLLPENDFLIDFDSIDEEIADKARFIVVSYPMNPVCATAPDSFYIKLIDWAKRHNVVVIHDNAYSEIIYDGEVGGSFLSYPGALDVGVEFNSLSKTYNLTGLRLSFLLGNEEIVNRFKSVRSQFDYGTSYIYQKAAIAALNGPQGDVRKQCRQYEKRRDVLVLGLEKLGLIPVKVKGSMFVWAKISKNAARFVGLEKGPDNEYNSFDYVCRLLNKTGILCTPGSSFGSLGEGYVRFALVLPDSKLNNIFAGIG